MTKKLLLLCALAGGLAAGGCVAYPYYDGGYPYYVGPPVVVGPPVIVYRGPYYYGPRYYRHYRRW